MSRPNVLFFYSDQHRFDALGVNGHPQAPTPVLDELAAEGTNFTHTFCPMAICTPTRCSMLTGAWPWRHGTVTNADSESFRPMDRTLPIVPVLLHEAGYLTAHVGRWHALPGTSPLEFGYEVHVSDKEYGLWRKEQNLPRPAESNWFGCVDEIITPEQSGLTWEADRMIEVLRQAAAADRPFHIEWHTVAPHLPNIVPEPYASMYPPSDVQPWPGFDDPLENKPYLHAQQQRSWKVDGWTWEQWAPMVGRYLGEISLYDRQIGRVLAALDELGLRDNTLVVYSSDHGDMCGSHGMIDKQHVMYDDIMRVPMILRLPGRLPVGCTCDDFLVNSLDLPWTFLELAGVERPETFVGRSVLTSAAGEDPDSRGDIYGFFCGNQFSLASQRMVRDRRWKYIWNAYAEDELYDLVNDPGEITNLAPRGESAGQLQRLRHRLVEWMEQTGDKLLNFWTRRQLLEGLTR